MRRPNRVTDDYGTVGGGANNLAGDGDDVTTNSRYATVSGGRGNASTAYGATVGGGDSNTAGGIQATVAGGWDNIASDMYDTVSGGIGNAATGSYSMVPGGGANTAAGPWSFAAGRNAKANHRGSFVWADSTSADFASGGNNQFWVRAYGGVFFKTSASTGPFCPANGTDFLPFSDRNAKENFEPIDNRQILEKVAALSVTKWNFKQQDDSWRHIGPMAQDFYAAFDVGYDNLHISSLDADGVALAAIQGLYQIVQEKDSEIAELKLEKDTEITELKTRLAALESAVTRMADQQ